MFVMMNLRASWSAIRDRQCELATQNAIRYAQERKQGKAFGARNRSSSIRRAPHADADEGDDRGRAASHLSRPRCMSTLRAIIRLRRSRGSADFVDLNTPL